MLRITTTPPEAKKLTSDSESNLPAPVPAVPVINEPTVPPAAVVVGNSANAGSSWKPPFLKGLGKNQGPTEEAVAAGDTAESVPAPAATSVDHLGASQPTE
jgi:hypothetical protein